MTIRKRRQPTPDFKIPAPFQPITGERAQLLVPGEFPYCALMQVAVEDTHADYVICRGFDPRVRKLFEYVEGDADKVGVPVAKPYGKRTVGVYNVGEIYPAFLPLSRIGQTPGVLEEGADGQNGQPLNLDDQTDPLKDANELYVNWLLIDSGLTMARFVLTENIGATTAGEAAALLISYDATTETLGETATEIVAKDLSLAGIFTGGLADMEGKGFWVAGNARAFVEIWQLGPCGA